MRKIQLYISALFAVFFYQTVSADPLETSRVVGSHSCMTSGCHGGAGPNRGAYKIWERYDPHHASAATLGSGRSEAMGAYLKLGEKPADSKSCTVCHDPMRQVDPAMFAPSAKSQGDENGVSCANCHGGAENWLLSHTRPEYPREALAKLGMRQLASPYERANNCVACHQNLSDELVAAKHPPLVFELDGLLIAEPKHWREEKDFSNAKTWLVGQAVALREAAAQALREPSDRRNAEIAAITALLEATGTGWIFSEGDLVRTADNYAKGISGAPLAVTQERAMLDKLVANRVPFQAGAFSTLQKENRMLAAGHYAERLTLALDRLNQSLASSGGEAPITGEALDEVFKASKPPQAFDADVADNFVRKLDRLAK
jgi:hypothetical protein